MDKEEKVGAATCKVLMKNNEIDDATHRGFPTPWNSLMFFTAFCRVRINSQFFDFAGAGKNRHNGLF
ncbi:MAG: hypothetical protein HYT36_01610 [Candidatus Staskawiczbacteria bacterium]|nr:hypothetical protein [Candidatus Staskawiczbacteria bacterium]